MTIFAIKKENWYNTRLFGLPQTGKTDGYIIAIVKSPKKQDMQRTITKYITMLIQDLSYLCQLIFYWR